jgi:hypothetical protein
MLWAALTLKAVGVEFARVAAFWLKLNERVQTVSLLGHKAASARKATEL